MKSLLALPEPYVRPFWRSCAIPGRPWWDLSAVKPPAWVYGRRDGATLPAVPLGHGPGAVFDGEALDAAAACGAYDLERPLPHPGFRLGQAWLWQFEDGEVLECLVQTHESVAALKRGYAPGGHLLCVLDCFLIHDLYRPDLAPWSGSC